MSRYLTFASAGFRLISAILLQLYRGRSRVKALSAAGWRHAASRGKAEAGEITFLLLIANPTVTFLIARPLSADKDQMEVHEI